MISRLALGSVRYSRTGLRVLASTLQTGNGSVSSLHGKQYPSMQWYHSTSYVRDSGATPVRACKEMWWLVYASHFDVLCGLRSNSRGLCIGFYFKKRMGEQ